MRAANPASALALLLAATAFDALPGRAPDEGACEAERCDEAPADEDALLQLSRDRSASVDGSATAGGEVEGDLGLDVSLTDLTEGVGPASSAERIYKLVKMEDKAKHMGALCLDGTPGAFYINPAPLHRKRCKKDNNWVIHLQGGGWCYDKPGCYNRSVTFAGSSAPLQPSRTADQLGLEGIMSDNCTVNPRFCNFTFVLVSYCDGASFSGNREDPVIYEPANFSMWFRGRRILNAVLETLREDYGLCDAADIFLGGDSAGGLAVFNNANHVQREITQRCLRQSFPRRRQPPSLRAVPGSGFFLFHGNVQQTMVWQAQMYNLYFMANWTITDNDCVKQYGPQLRWLCLFPQNIYGFIKLPIFVSNSILDLWQVANILSAEPITGFPDDESPEVSFWVSYNASAALGWGDSTCPGGWPDRPDGGLISGCSSRQINAMNQYMDNFQLSLTYVPTFRKMGNGAFIYACYNHNAEMLDLDYVGYRVEGVSMRDALARWWDSLDCWEPASRHTYVEAGRYRHPANSKQVNPTCNKWTDGFPFR